MRHRTQTLYLLNDADGDSLNKEYFKKDSFFTAGGSSLGVLWLRHNGSISNVTRFAAPKYEYKWYFDNPLFDIALSRAEMKNNPDDEAVQQIRHGKQTDFTSVKKIVLL